MSRKALTAGEETRTGHGRYLQRKIAELTLIEQRLSRPPPPPRISHLASLLKRKFKSAALCRAEMAAHQWSQTETRWKAGPCGAGAFRFHYEYQRADLTVEGPSAYSVRGLEERLLPTHHTTSGMAALSAALLAFRRVWPGCHFDARGDGYPETREFIGLLPEDRADSASRVVVLDSTVDTPKTARARLARAAGAVFDTSCFAASSSRIRAIVCAVQDKSLPIVLIRSHTKLDCFGPGLWSARLSRGCPRAGRRA